MPNRVSSRQVLRRVLKGLLIMGLLVGGLNLNAPSLPVAHAATYDIPDGDVTALKAALDNPAPDKVINLAAGGVYTLTTVDNSFRGKTGLPAISNTVTINGNGATLARAYNAPNFRFFYVAPLGTLTLNNLTLFNGSVSEYDEGGAIGSYGALNLNYTTFYSNSAQQGGGAIISIGAGTSNFDPVPSTSYTSSLTIKASSFISNSSPRSGGAIFNAGFGGSTISNTNGSGGNGTLIVKIEGSTFLSNSVANGGGAIANNVTGGTGANGGSGTLLAEISNSTFALNQGGSGGAAIGTVNSNPPNNTGTASAFVTITNSTIVNNISPRAIILFKLYPDGLGLANTTLRNTIVAANVGENCLGYYAAFSPGVNNLEYMDGSSGTASCGPGSTVVTSPPVASLIPTNNGGSTKTVLPAGAALNGGDNAVCAAAPVNNLDQRGVTRPIGPACDVGAVEASSADCPQFVVSAVLDDGNGNTCGTLSYLLAHSVSGSSPVTITFGLTSGNTITFTGPLVPPVKANVRLDGGASGGIVLNGGGVSGDGLRLQGQNILINLTVKGFLGRQVVTEGPGNLFNRLRVLR